jgi:hypothetical protein
MLKLMGFLLKWLAISAIILTLGNWLQWDGQTLADRVKTGTDHLPKYDVLKILQGWAESLTRDAKKGIQNKINSSSLSLHEEISLSERQKLKTLIRELNTPSEQTNSRPLTRSSAF